MQIRKHNYSLQMVRERNNWLNELLLEMLLLRHYKDLIK